MQSNTPFIRSLTCTLKLESVCMHVYEKNNQLLFKGVPCNVSKFDVCKTTRKFALVTHCIHFWNDGIRLYCAIIPMLSYFQQGGCLLMEMASCRQITHAQTHAHKHTRTHTQTGILNYKVEGRKVRSMQSCAITFNQCLGLKDEAIFGLITLVFCP